MCNNENVPLVTCGALQKDTPIIMEHNGVPKKASMYRCNYFLAAYAAHGCGYLSMPYKNDTALYEGDIVFLKPDCAHSMHCRINFMELYYCKILPEHIFKIRNEIIHHFPKSRNFFENKDFIIVHDYPDFKIRDIFVSMIDEQMSDNIGYAEILSAYLKILLFNIFRINTDSNMPLHHSDNKWVGMTVQYIYLHLYDGVNLKELAKIHNITPEHLCRTFKKHMGMTISEFINDVRIRKIKDMLANTNRSVRSVNELFNVNPQYLQKCFKRDVGMSMSEYRKKYRNNKEEKIPTQPKGTDADAELTYK